MRPDAGEGDSCGDIASSPPQGLRSQLRPGLVLQSLPCAACREHAPSGEKTRSERRNRLKGSFEGYALPREGDTVQRDTLGEQREE